MIQFEPLIVDLLMRLRKGERVVLYGRRGAGKSTVVAALQEKLEREGIPCGHCAATAHLDDITQALQRAYPTIDVTSVRRRAARSRLWLAADQTRGVLLLDHVTQLSNAMVGFLRHLVGGVAGVLLVLDVDTTRERSKMRPGRLGAVPLQIPPLLPAAMRSLWLEERIRRDLPDLPLRAERQLMHAAEGRPGWLVQCAALAERSRYWREGQLALVNLLCSDTEIAVRYGARALADLESKAHPIRGGGTIDPISQTATAPAGIGPARGQSR